MDINLFLSELKPELPVDKKAVLKQQLAVYLNDLLLHDFHSLVQLLYRVDVPEKKIKAVLQEHPTEDAGNLLAGLLIQRQAEKQATRNRFHFPPGSSDEERW